ncbi:hypothetical protein I5G97_gp034 [Mycobacterium phage Curiosium]|uniref:Uncharacterized protein n=1 Tax=Mycobacterium phage Curiosium TaxID=2599859 RepID=A0A5J6TW26_9CAUD|nr:hypothetical protein I5G97_gp034 [Mycobacterium phage Curiosium]QFG14119.1 hypothetical protein PBI_CURIOSIUM_76 [Mycobacterium phage Curiosium]
MFELHSEARIAARHAIAGVVADIALHRCAPTEALLDSIVSAVAVHTTIQPPKPDRYELTVDERRAAVTVLVARRHDAGYHSADVLDEVLAAINGARGFGDV